MSLHILLQELPPEIQYAIYKNFTISELVSLSNDDNYKYLKDINYDSLWGYIAIDNFNISYINEFNKLNNTEYLCWYDICKYFSSLNCEYLTLLNLGKLKQFYILKYILEKMDPKKYKKKTIERKLRRRERSIILSGLFYSAIEDNNISLLQFLIMGQKYKIETTKISILYEALCRNEELELLNYIEKIYGDFILYVDKNSIYNIFSEAASAGRLHIIKFIYNKFGRKKEYSNIVLEKSIINGDNDMFRWAYSVGANLCNNYGRPLFIALEIDNKFAIDFLISKGVGIQINNILTTGQQIHCVSEIEYNTNFDIIMKRLINIAAKYGYDNIIRSLICNLLHCYKNKDNYRILEKELMDECKNIAIENKNYDTLYVIKTSKSLCYECWWESRHRR
ncbi:Ankyrin-repeat protein [Orpheovirus IHUMI-LCC2]|uniref:Ankyrin-repeat protein n=1 Tax=Orpheovirus IHUMI-LCC2 TaxID=2023057 RepID=A0A2I2L427_9VIRU|nr:Ankyrin-repeat protein [Orpheovirus IHUMI-LCC2]SNW62270.1 Ankyrin-repeat protein [Orpheovirus IHUMI-LCC2]